MSWCPTKFYSGHHMSQVIPSHKDVTFWQRMQTFWYSHIEKKRVGTGETKMCRLMNTESRLRLWHDDEEICKEKWICNFYQSYHFVVVLINHAVCFIFCQAKNFVFCLPARSDVNVTKCSEFGFLKMGSLHFKHTSVALW